MQSLFDEEKMRISLSERVGHSNDSVFHKAVNSSALFFRSASRHCRSIDVSTRHETVWDNMDDQPQGLALS